MITNTKNRYVTMKTNKAGFCSIFVKFNEKHSVPHQIFYKQHKVREETDDRPSDLTLFVCNVPPYYNEDCLKRLFKSCGLVRKVFFAENKTPTVIITSKKKSFFDQTKEVNGYKVAYVVFTSANDLQKALSWKPSSPVTLTDNEFSVVTGLKKLCQQYNDSFSDPSDMQKEINEFMVKFDEENKQNEKLQKQITEPDDEGWLTVTKKGRNPGFARKQSVKDNIMKSLKRKKRRKTLLNFYTFQIKESKMNHLTKLREKFEEDKKKIDSLKLKRKFKPF